MPYALRHSYASWSLAAAVNVFTLARRMGTSVEQIDKTCGHLVSGEDARESEMVDAWDAFARSTPVESDEAVIRI